MTHHCFTQSSVLNFLCLITLRECPSLMQSLTRSLQERKMGVGCALPNVSVVKNSIQVFRNELVLYGFRKPHVFLRSWL